MRILIISVLFLFVAPQIKAQKKPGSSYSNPVVINAKLIGKDSVIIPYDGRYNIVKEECTKMIRHGHFNFKTNHFFGKFKDLSATDSTMVLAEGSFTKEGLKDGEFDVKYPDGTLEAKGRYMADKYEGDWSFYYPNGAISSKGTFLNDKYSGVWEFYHSNGQKALVFAVKGKDVTVVDEWRDDGTQLVKAGNGSFISLNGVVWHGKLVNGAPDSTWTCDFFLRNPQPTYITETFANGKLQAGQVKGPIANRDYNDRSVIDLLPNLPKVRIASSQGIFIHPYCDGEEPTGSYSIYYKAFGKTSIISIIALKGSSYSQN